MARTRTIRGVATQHDTPDWRPLEKTVGRDLAGDFMWMHEVTLDDGRTLQAYKHIYTRRYVHLDSAGKALVHHGRDRYRPHPVADVLAAVFGPLSGGLLGVTDDQIARSWAAVERLQAAADGLSPPDSTGRDDT
jgi:hypothetical protein